MTKPNKKVCLVSDIHFGVNKNSEMYLASAIRYFRDELVPYLEKEGIKDLIILGDVFDNRNNINVKINDDVYYLFKETFADFRVTLLIGNHDIYYKNSNEIHSLKYLSHLDNIDVIEDVCYREFHGVPVLMCPWIYDYKDTATLHKLSTCDSNIIMGHFDIVGFQLNRTTVSTEGLSPDVFGAKKVFSGHYHTPSSKKVGKTEIIYVGSPYQMTRNDKNETKGCIILNVESLRYKRIPNTTSIEFVEVEYPEVPEAEYVEGNIVDAIIKIKKKDLTGNLVDKYVESIEALNPIDRVNIVLNIESEESGGFDEDIHGNMSSLPDLFEMYINNDPEIDDEDKATYLHSILDIYNEVN